MPAALRIYLAGLSLLSVLTLVFMRDRSREPRLWEPIGGLLLPISARLRHRRREMGPSEEGPTMSIAVIIGILLVLATASFQYSV